MDLREALTARAAELRAVLDEPERPGFLRATRSWQADLALTEYVLTHGVDFRVAPLQVGRLGAPKTCFRTAARFVREHDGATYVEGFALDDVAGAIHHAWVTAGDGLAVELVWATPGIQYLGVPLSPEQYTAGSEGLEREDALTWLATEGRLR